MTCIAYRDGTLAADSRVSYGATYHDGKRHKIVRCGSYWIALAGAAWTREAIEEWVTTGCDPKAYPTILRKAERDFGVLLMDDSGLCYDLCSRGYIVRIPSDYRAIGSGCDFALGAMAVGASAIDAVQAACQHEKSCGGEITHVVAPYPSEMMPSDAAVTGRASHLLPN